MVLNSGKELGRVIARQQHDIDRLKQDLNPNDPSASFPLFGQESITVTKSITFKKKPYLADSFIIDHVTLGDIDSSTLKIDGGYDTGAGDYDEVLFIGDL